MTNQLTGDSTRVNILETKEGGGGRPTEGGAPDPCIRDTAPHGRVTEETRRHFTPTESLRCLSSDRTSGPKKLPKL